MGSFNKELPNWYKKSLSRLNKKNNDAKPWYEKELEKNSKNDNN